MKRYEKTFQNVLQPRTYTILRLDGKAFHTFTRGLYKPWDHRLVTAMESAMGHCFNEISGAKFAYCQSDEISLSLVLTDFDKFETQAWFDNKVQKIVSVSASLATVGFNRAWLDIWMKNHNSLLSEIVFATFDSRVFQVPNEEEVVNYFIWRQQDAIRNSVAMMAQNYFSHKKLHGKNVVQMKEMLKDIGSPWEDVEIHLQRGSGCKKINDDIGESLYRSYTHIDHDLPVFSVDRDFIKELLPEMP